MIEELTSFIVKAIGFSLIAVAIYGLVIATLIEAFK